MTGQVISDGVTGLPLLALDRGGRDGKVPKTASPSGKSLKRCPRTSLCWQRQRLRGWLPEPLSFLVCNRWPELAPYQQCKGSHKLPSVSPHKQLPGLTKYYKIFYYMWDRNKVWLHKTWGHVDQSLLAPGQVVTAFWAPCIALVEVILKEANGLTCKSVLWALPFWLPFHGETETHQACFNPS